MFWLTSLIGKMIVFLSRHLGGGHGSALPGLIVERIYPTFLAKLLDNLPGGVVLVSGTNGKTTTTKIVVDLLRADGYRVFTNPSGSNYTRGVISAALPMMRRGRLAADIAVLELDEAYATSFVDQVKPKYSLLLNVLRDQLDRFGEIDNTAKLLQYVAQKTTGVVVLNEDDDRLRRIASDDGVNARVDWFGYSSDAGKLYRSDEELHGTKRAKVKANASGVRIVGLRDSLATYAIDEREYSVKLRLFGVHNALNCAAALSLVRRVEGDQFVAERAVEHLGAIRPAFGRGEVITVGETEIRLILVKNPSGFQISLDSVGNLPTMMLINDAHADGRDVSWLWDVTFGGVADDSLVAVGGVRAYDMALRLAYDGVKTDWIEPDVRLAVGRFVRKLSGGSGQIFATYTAMLVARDELEKLAKKGAK